MKLFTAKDGGPESTVRGYWLVEDKKRFSIVLLRFDGASRDVYHTRAFDCFSWVLSGCLFEHRLRSEPAIRVPSFRGFWTHRTTFHKVDSLGTSWVLSIRGPWAKFWREYDPRTKGFTVLTNHRVKV